MVRRIKIGDKFIVRDGIEVTVTRYKDTTCMEVTDGFGNFRTVNAQSLLVGRLQWRYKDGSVKKDEFPYDMLSEGQKPVKTRAKREPEGDVYYVYQVSVLGLIVYVGQGKGARLRHTLSGSSHNRHLNRLLFLKAPMIAEVLADNLSKEAALSLEDKLIKHHRPHCNVKGLGN